MNFAAPPALNSWAFTPGLYLARMSCTGRGPAGCKLTASGANWARVGLYNSPSGASFIHGDPGGRIHAFMWCTTFGLPGRTSAALTHTSLGKLTFTSRLD